MQASGGQSLLRPWARATLSTYRQLLPTVGREPVGPQKPWPTGREPRVYSREGGTLGLVGGVTGYGELRRPWARVPLTGLP